MLAVRGSDSPFVFIWDTDLVAIIVRAVGDGPAGVYNVPGTGTLTIDQIAAPLGKRTLAVPEPVLDNSRLREVFGYSPELTSAEAFDRWLAVHPAARA
ncbi:MULTISPECIES: hypothetical protein [Dietzia]|uniref:hypothetical protein n=1 Tax=Dietzia TaxID=37914 RepID=UPI0033690CC6